MYRSANWASGEGGGSVGHTLRCCLVNAVPEPGLDLVLLWPFFTELCLDFKERKRRNE